MRAFEAPVGSRAVPEDAVHLRARPATWWLIVGATLGLCVPLVVALAGLRRPVWTPVLDLAMTELRVRDVGGPHTPLVGLPGRIGSLDAPGSHPGPLSFYALALPYRVLGSTAWALQVATVVIHAVGVGATLWLADRRGGRILVAGVATLLALLMAAYGGGALTEPWNPYLPLLWWVVVLLAAWSVLAGDLPALPLLVAAASFCAQTHVPYLGLCLGVGAVAVAGAVVAARRDPSARGPARRWILGALGLGVLLWLPPTAEQLTSDPGNQRVLIEHFTDPSEDPVGLRSGAELALERLDVVHLVRAAIEGPGWLITDAEGHVPSAPRGAVVLGAWLVAVAVAARRRDRDLLVVHLVLAAASALMALAIGRIFGTVWYYLTLWGWAIGALMAGVTLWTVAGVVSERWDAHRRSRAVQWTTLGLAALALAVAARFAVAAGDTPHADERVAAGVATVADDVADAVRAGEGATDGPDGTYLVTWTDPVHIGSQGYGLLSELERRGLDVGVEESRRVPATEHRVLEPGEPTARIHLTTGTAIDRYRSLPDAVELAYADVRTDAEREEQADLRAAVEAGLDAAGIEGLAGSLDDNLFGASIDPRLTPALKRQIERMLEIGGPLAVFALPPDTADP